MNASHEQNRRKDDFMKDLKARIDEQNQGLKGIRCLGYRHLLHQYPNKYIVKLVNDAPVFILENEPYELGTLVIA